MANIGKSRHTWNDHQINKQHGDQKLHISDRLLLSQGRYHLNVFHRKQRVWDCVQVVNGGINNKRKNGKVDIFIYKKRRRSKNMKTNCLLLLYREMEGRTVSWKSHGCSCKRARGLIVKCLGVPRTAKILSCDYVRGLCFKNVTMEKLIFSFW